MPLVAQITGAVALTALVMGPWWSKVPSDLPTKAPSPAIHAAPLPAAVPQVSPAQPGASAAAASTPAHLNLDVRHSFADMNLTVMVDGRRVLASSLEGSGKRFKMFGKRAERGYTKSLELEPGVRVVQVRMQSAPEKFDQTRTERFDLSSSAVASMRISADRSGLDVITQHPPAPRMPADLTPVPAAKSGAAMPATSGSPITAATLPAAQQADALAEVVKSLRSMLIAIAGFVASAATGFIVQEFLRGKRDIVFAGERRRRRQRDDPEVAS